MASQESGWSSDEEVVVVEPDAAAEGEDDARSVHADSNDGGFDSNSESETLRLGGGEESMPAASGGASSIQCSSDDFRIDHWLRPLTRALSSKISLFRQRRPLRVLSGCSGILAEGHALKARLPFACKYLLTGRTVLCFS